MSRRVFALLLVASTIASADERSDALEAIAPIADALSNNDAESLVRFLPADMPDVSTLRDNVAALMAQAEVTSSIEVISADKGSAELDWSMRIRSRETGTVIEQRRAMVKIQYRKRKLQSIDPVSFFAPPKVEQQRKK